MGSETKIPPLENKEAEDKTTKQAAGTACPDINTEKVKVTSDFEKRPDDYYDHRDISIEGWRTLCKVKDQSIAMYDKRWQAAKLVIDAIARRVGIDSETCGLYLYAPYDANGDSEMLRRLNSYFDQSGDKVKLKRRIDELERENAILRSLIREV